MDEGRTGRKGDGREIEEKRERNCERDELVVRCSPVFSCFAMLFPFYIRGFIFPDEYFFFFRGLEVDQGVKIGK